MILIYCINRFKSLFTLRILNWVLNINKINIIEGCLVQLNKAEYVYTFTRNLSAFADFIMFCNITSLQFIE